MPLEMPQVNRIVSDIITKCNYMYDIDVEVGFRNGNPRYNTIVLIVPNDLEDQEEALKNIKRKIFIFAKNEFNYVITDEDIKIEYKDRDINRDTRGIFK